MLFKSIKSNKYWIVISILGGITLIFGTVSHKMAPSDLHNIEMLKGMFSGVGFAFLGVGIFNLVQNKRAPAEKLKAKEIELKDERNIEILRIAYSLANIIAMALFIGMAFLFIGLDYIIPGFISLGAMFVQVTTFLLAYRYYNKKM